MVWLLGCSHTIRMGAPTQDQVWRVEMVRVIALDLKDGTLDYVWQQNVAQDTRDAIIADARELNNNASGRR